VSTVDADQHAREFIREHGGCLYIWESEAGIEHETTKPRHGIDFKEIEADGFTLYVDPAIEMPQRWKLDFHRFPNPRVRALWNGGVWSPNGSRMPSWEGDRPFDN
jgi:hypothetical protein